MPINRRWRAVAVWGMIGVTRPEIEWWASLFPIREEIDDVPADTALRSTPLVLFKVFGSKHFQLRFIRELRVVGPGQSITNQQIKEIVFDLGPEFVWGASSSGGEVRSRRFTGPWHEVSSLVGG
jgi:hypothetical protein